MSHFDEFIDSYLPNAWPKLARLEIDSFGSLQRYAAEELEVVGFTDEEIHLLDQTAPGGLRKRNEEEEQQHSTNCSHCRGIRDRSGTVSSTNPMVSFLYELMRGHVPPGVVEQIMANMEVERGKEVVFTNGWLANYAKDVAARLRP
jgi:hypothetical protein